MNDKMQKETSVTLTQTIIHGKVYELNCPDCQKYPVGIAARRIWHGAMH